jgi:hypothetical protein
MARHTEESAELFVDFVNTMRKCAENDGYRLHELSGQAQLLRIEGQLSATLNVRTDAKDNGWWGFTKNVDKGLAKAKRKWFLVFLEGTPGEGYLLSDVEVAGAKARWDDAGKQYIIHPHQLRDVWKFRGVEVAWRRIKSILHGKLSCP